jgi:DNA-binding response OmpR family regulator
MTGKGITVGVIEDHPMYRSALTQLLGAAPGFEVDAAAESVAQFAARRRYQDSVVILDLRLPGVRDSAAVMAVVAMGHKVLVVSAHASQNEVLGAMAAGARGFLSKDVDGDEILRALRQIAAGDSYVRPAGHRHPYRQVLFGPDQGQDRPAQAIRADQVRHRAGSSGCSGQQVGLVPALARLRQLGLQIVPAGRSPAANLLDADVANEFLPRGYIRCINTVILCKTLDTRSFIR